MVKMTTKTNTYHQPIYRKGDDIGEPQGYMQKALSQEKLNELIKWHKFHEEIREHAKKEGIKDLKFE